MFGLLVALLLAAPSSAAVIAVKGGGFLQGTIISRSATEIVVQTEHGPRSIATEQVLSVAEDAPGYSDAGASEVSIGLGIGVPLDELGFGSFGGGRAGNGALGPLVGLEYLQPSGPRLSWGAAFEYFHRGGSESPSGVPLAVTSVGGDTLLLLASAKLFPTAARTVRPFLKLGLGGHRTTTNVDVTPLGGFVWGDTATGETRRFARGAAWGLAARAVLGLDMDLADPTFFTFEAGWLGLHNAAYEATPAGRAAGYAGAKPILDSFLIAGRWGWRF